ncbi:MAG: YraN family protein, partial [Caldilineales bacterium]|nr:YraN family protein [Caldilineales bacterium]
MTTSRIALGRRGEALAVQALAQWGYTLIACNWRCQAGEVDLIARRDEVLTFFEVRTRRGAVCGSPEESITPRKRARMEAVARCYLAEHLPDADPSWQLGVIAIVLDVQGRLQRITLYPDLESDGWTLF